MELTHEAEIHRAKDYAAAHFADGCRLAEMADAACMSMYHFLRMFHRETGVTPKAYLAGLQINRAMTLLTETDMPIVEIALQCGFADHSHFSTRFKALNGKTPREFRRLREAVPALER